MPDPPSPGGRPPRPIPADQAGAASKPERPPPQATPVAPPQGPPVAPPQSTPVAPPQSTPVVSGEESFDFGDSTQSAQTRRGASRQGRRRRSPLVLVAVTLLLFAGIGGLLAWWSQGQAIRLEAIDDHVIDESSLLELPVRVTNAGRQAGRIEFALAKAPRGARLDSRTGKFTWRPSESQGPKQFTIRVRATLPGLRPTVLEQEFEVDVREVIQPPALEPIPEKTLDPGGTLAFLVRAADPDIPSKPVRFQLGLDAPLGARIDPQSGHFQWKAQNAKPGESFEIAIVATKGGAGGLSAEQTFRVSMNKPAAVAEITPKPKKPEPPVPKKPEAKPAEEAMAEKTPAGEAAKLAAKEEGDDILLELFQKNRLLVKSEYPKLRKVFADRFRAEHAGEIEEAFGASDGEMRQWLGENVEIAEELYLAIDPAHDKITPALTLFRELKERFPEKLASYANLAIAVAVVWDDPENGIHKSPRAQHRSVAAEGEFGGVENFQFYVESERAMQGRTQYLPWEFLVYLVNHRTPLAERHWALNAYVSKRSMFGKCYEEVPYDTAMRQGEDPKLTEKPHTLPNILRFGGVCSCQADFAGRVGKSIGVPAFSVGGQSRYGEDHAWVMWVELGRVTRTGFTFSLESHGRFRGDHYYVGDLADPHTGQATTDRDVERRLHAVGRDPIAKRHADCVMRAYPMLRDQTALDTTSQLLFLSRVLDLSPGNEAAWLALAKISQEGHITQANSKPMMHMLERLFSTFANLPDFTWVVFDDLVAFQDLPKQRAALFGQLATLYEQAGRPDLSCEARLKYSDYLKEDERVNEAIQGLTMAILYAPNEGNFVPKMLDKLEALCGENSKAQRHLVHFYQQFLPKIRQKRGSVASNYCMKMYERGIRCFKEAGMKQLGDAYQAQLTALEAIRSP